MTDDQQTLNEFATDTHEQAEHESPRQNPDDGVDTTSDDGTEAEALKSEGEPGDLGKLRDLLTGNRGFDSGLNFGLEPEDFDIDNKWARRYLAYKTVPTLTHKTLSEDSAFNYESTLRAWVNFLHDHNKTVLNAEFEFVIVYVLHSIELGRRTKTIRTHLSKIKGLYKHIELNETVSAEISSIEFEEIDMQEVDKLTPNALERGALSKEKLKRLFDAMTRERDRLMVITGVETGFRNSDIRGIRLMDIDWDEPEIKAHSPKYGDPYSVPISEELALELELWIDHGRDDLLVHNESEYLFPPANSDGMIESSDTLGSIVVEAAEDAKIQGVLGETHFESKYLKVDRVKRTWHEVVPHVLRHTFITLLEKEGVPLEYRRLLANHKSVETTMAYSHGKLDVLKEAQARLDLDF